MCHCGDMESGNDTKSESAHKVNSGEENPPAAPAGIRTRNLSITSPVLSPLSYPGSKSCKTLRGFRKKI